jgi:hypothetical protein
VGRGFLAQLLALTLSQAVLLLPVPPGHVVAEGDRDGLREDAVGASRGQSCLSGCAVELDHVVTLSDVQPAVLPDQSVHVFLHKSGRYLVSSTTRQHVVVFDGRGTVEKLLGKRGSAPGEFEVLNNLIPGPSHTFVAYDSILKRVTIIAPDLTLGHTRQLPFKPAIARADGTYIVAQQIRTPELIGFPMHLVAQDGGVLRSFGTDAPMFRVDLQPLLGRVVTAGDNGTVWAAHQGRHTFEQWDPATGKLHRRFDVPSWFTASVRDVTDERRRPNAIVEAIWARGSFLWVFSRDADAQWKSPERPNAERPFEIGEYDRTYDWVIDVVDIASGRVVANRRLPIAHWASPTTELIASQRPGTAGNGRKYDVWRPRLKARED